MSRLSNTLLGRILRRIVTQANRRLRSWFAVQRGWDWLFDRARAVPPRRFNAELQILEERISPSVTAVNDSYSTPFAQPLTVQAAGILTNDEGTGLSSSLVAQASHGTATVNPDGSLTYTQSDFTFVGFDSIVYEAHDSSESDTASVTIQIQQAVTSTVLIVSAESIYQGDSVTLTAQVSSVATQAGPVTGSITFRDGSTILAVVGLNANGSAAFSTSAWNLGNHEITAEYLPSGVFAASNSQPKTVAVTQAPVWIEASQDDILVGDTVGFNAYPYDFNLASVDDVEWDFNYDGNTFNPDSATAGQLSVQQSFSAPVTKTIAARILTTSGYVQLSTIEVRAHHPAPELTVPNDMTIFAGDTPTIALQVETEFEITSVEWWFSYDGEEWEQDETLDDLAEQVAFPTYGEVDVWVKVIDENGESAEDGFHISVEEAVPLATSIATGPNGAVSGNAALLNEGQIATFTVWLTDRDIQDTDTIWANWYGLPGDENFWFVEPEEITLNPDGSISFEHLYDNNPASGNVYHAIISIENEGGDYVNCPVDVIVNNVAPSGTWFTNAITGNQWVKFALIQEGARVEFIVIDPSAADRAEMEYHWRIVDEDTGTQLFNGMTNDPYYVLPDAKMGKVYWVEAYAKEKDGAASDTVSQLAVIGPWGVDITRQYKWRFDDGDTHEFTQPSQYWINDIPEGLYGTLTRQGSPAPTEWYRFMEGNELVQDLNYPDLPTLQFQLDARSQAIIPPGTDVIYRFEIGISDVEQFSIGPGNNELLDTIVIENTTGILQLPGELINYEHPEYGRLDGYRKDREIVVNAVARMAGYFGEPGSEGYAYPHTPTYTYIGTTIKTATTFDLDAWAELYTTIRLVVANFADRAEELIDAITDGNEGGFIGRVAQGFSEAIAAYFGNLTSNLGNGVYNWLKSQANGIDFSAFTNLNLSDSRHIKAFALQFSGLTWDKLSGIVLQTLGEGNVAIASKIAGWFENIDTGNMLSMLDFLEALPAKVTALGLEDVSLNFDMTTLLNQLKTEAEGAITAAVTTASKQLALLFVPGAGAIKAIYNGLTWLAKNKQQLSDLLAGFLDAVLQTNATAVKDRLLQTFTGATEMVVSFAAAQFGLNRLPGLLRQATSFVPSKVESGLRAMLSKGATKLRAVDGTSDSLFDGILTDRKEFSYPTPNGAPNYVIWAARDKLGVKVKLAEKVGGQWKILDVLKASSFVGTAAQTHYQSLFDKAGALANAANSSAPKTPAAIASLGTKSTQVKTAEIDLAGDASACKVINAGCFAAGTKLWTPDGYRNVEDIKPGEFVYSRDEWDPEGEIEAKVVEEKFERTGRILHLHVNGEAIRTTPEHPFHERRHGWIAAGSLQTGDEIRTDSDWVRIEEVFDTGEYETVYNLRVAEWHTYFVGEQNWGWSAWAHNSYTYTLEQNRLTYAFHHPGPMQQLVDTAIQYRLDHQDLRGGRNVAVVWCRRPDGSQAIWAVPSLPNSVHSEPLLLSEVLNRGFQTQDIVAIYSERSPCRDCRSLLGPARTPTSLGICENRFYWSFNYYIDTANIKNYIDAVIEPLR